MTTATLNVARVNDGLSSPSQLNLPSGPLGLVRPRRERTDEDKAVALRANSRSSTHDRHCRQGAVYDEGWPTTAALNRRAPGLSVAWRGWRVNAPISARLRTAQRAISVVSRLAGVVKCLNSRRAATATSGYLSLSWAAVSCLGVTADCRARGDSDATQ